jgi:hypothetical protein
LLTNIPLAPDLATVEEVDTQLDIDDVPNTPPQHELPIAVPHSSPGAASQMSGTTAISSFSMVEAEFLEPRFMIRKLRKLYETSEEFLDHLVPMHASLDDDHQNIRAMQMPDSDFSADYRDFDAEATVYLNGFRGEHQRYISRKAVHRALFGPNLDASRCGLDLVLFAANLLIFAKQAIHSDRREKESWDALRELDNSFPAFFLSKLVPGSDSATFSRGDSIMLRDTFDLALELRTQLAILHLERSSAEDHFNPDDALDEVFFQSTTEGDGALIQGWNNSALGGDGIALPQHFQGKIIERMNKIREFFPTDEESLQRGDMPDIDGLGDNFPWESLVLRLLGWVRSRNKELRQAIDDHGGINSIVAKVKTEVEQPNPTEAAPPAARDPPPKKKASFGDRRRKSTGKSLDLGVVDRLKAKERAKAAYPQPPPPAPQQEIDAEEPAHVAPEVVVQEEDDEVAATPALPEVNAQNEAPFIPDEEERQDEWLAPIDNEPEDIVEELQEPVEEVAGPSRPPQSTAETLSLLKQRKRPDKENRAASLFERQANAQRVEFGDGFGDDTQPPPQPSQKGKEPQRALPTKRRRPVEESDDDDDDVFETTSRTARVQEQRERAKGVRVEPTSSNAPPSHQPRPRDDLFVQQNEQDESASENEAPEISDAVPPRSTFADQRALARANHRPVIVNRQRHKPRKPRTAWSAREEQALIEYMEKYPRGYAQILQHDEDTHGLLQDRTQVNLKDKARNMAIIMIK